MGGVVEQAPFHPGARLITRQDSLEQGAWSSDIWRAIGKRSTPAPSVESLDIDIVPNRDNSPTHFTPRASRDQNHTSNREESFRQISQPLQKSRWAGKGSYDGSEERFEADVQSNFGDHSPATNIYSQKEVGQALRSDRETDRDNVRTIPSLERVFGDDHTMAEIKPTGTEGTGACSLKRGGKQKSCPPLSGQMEAFKRRSMNPKTNKDDNGTKERPVTPLRPRSDYASLENSPDLPFDGRSSPQSVLITHVGETLPHLDVENLRNKEDMREKEPDVDSPVSRRIVSRPLPPLPSSIVEPNTGDSWVKSTLCALELQIRDEKNDPKSPMNRSSDDRLKLPSAQLRLQEESKAEVQDALKLPKVRLRRRCKLDESSRTCSSYASHSRLASTCSLDLSGIAMRQTSDIGSLLSSRATSVYSIDFEDPFRTDNGASKAHFPAISDGKSRTSQLRGVSQPPTSCQSNRLTSGASATGSRRFSRIVHNRPGSKLSTPDDFLVVLSQLYRKKFRIFLFDDDSGHDRYIRDYQPRNHRDQESAIRAASQEAVINWGKNDAESPVPSSRRYISMGNEMENPQFAPRQGYQSHASLPSFQKASSAQSALQDSKSHTLSSDDIGTEKGSGITPSKSLRTLRAYLDTTSVTDLIDDLADDEESFVQDIEALIKDVIPVLSGTFSATSRLETAAGISQRTVSGSRESSPSQIFTDMSVVLKRMKILHSPITLQDAEKIFNWSRRAYPTYSRYLALWHSGHQAGIYISLPSYKIPGAVSTYSDSGVSLHASEKLYDTKPLLRRPIDRLKTISKLVKGLHLNDPNEFSLQDVQAWEALEARSRKQPDNKGIRVVDSPSRDASPAISNELQVTTGSVVPKRPKIINVATSVSTNSDKSSSSLKSASGQSMPPSSRQRNKAVGLRPRSLSAEVFNHKLDGQTGRLREDRVVSGLDTAPSVFYDEPQQSASPKITAPEVPVMETRSSANPIQNEFHDSPYSGRKDEISPIPPPLRLNTADSIESTSPKPGRRKNKGHSRRATSPLKHEFSPANTFQPRNGQQTPSDESYSPTDLSFKNSMKALSDARTETKTSPSQKPVAQSVTPSKASRLSSNNSKTMSCPRSISSYTNPHVNLFESYFASVSYWSADTGLWVDLHSQVCSIIVRAGIVETYHASDAELTSHENRVPTDDSIVGRPRQKPIGRPLVAQELTPLVSLRLSTAVDIEVHSPPTSYSIFQESKTIRYRTLTAASAKSLQDCLETARRYNLKFNKLEQERVLNSPEVLAAEAKSEEPHQPSFRASVDHSTSSPVNFYNSKSHSRSSSIIPHLRRLSDGGGLFRTPKRPVLDMAHISMNDYSSSVDSTSSPHSSSSRSTSRYTSPHTSTSSIPLERTTASSTVANACEPLRIEDINVKLFRLVPPTKWEDKGKALLTITSPSTGMRQRSSLYHGIERRIILRLALKEQTIVLDEILGADCFSQLGRTGIVIHVWEEAVGDNGEIGRVRRTGGVSGKINKWLIRTSSHAEMMWIFSLCAIGKT